MLRLQLKFRPTSLHKSTAKQLIINCISDPTMIFGKIMWTRLRSIHRRTQLQNNKVSTTKGMNSQKCVEFRCITSHEHEENSMTSQRRRKHNNASKDGRSAEGWHKNYDWCFAAAKHKQKKNSRPSLCVRMITLSLLTTECAISATENEWLSPGN